MLLISSFLKLIRFFKAVVHWFVTMATIRKLTFVVLLIFCFFITINNQKSDTYHRSASSSSSSPYFPPSIAFPPLSSYGASRRNPRSPEKAKATATLTSMDDHYRKLLLGYEMTTRANLQRTAPPILRRLLNDCFIDQAGSPFYPKIRDWHDSNFSAAETAIEFLPPRLGNRLKAIGGYGSRAFEEWVNRTLFGIRGGGMFNCKFFDLQEIEEPSLYVSAGYSTTTSTILVSPSPSSSITPSPSPSPSPSPLPSPSSKPSHLDFFFTEFSHRDGL